MAVRTVYVSEGISLLNSKIENAHGAEKTTTTRCGIRETATTRNFVFVAVFKQPLRWLG